MQHLTTPTDDRAPPFPNDRCRSTPASLPFRKSAPGVWSRDNVLVLPFSAADDPCARAELTCKFKAGAVYDLSAGRQGIRPFRHRTIKASGKVFTCSLTRSGNCALGSLAFKSPCTGGVTQKRVPLLLLDLSRSQYSLRGQLQMLQRSPSGTRMESS
jgi:hypothetical protein